jgi:hypothetical protein
MTNPIIDSAMADSFTWVNSQWRLRTYRVQFQVKINTRSRSTPDHAVLMMTITKDELRVAPEFRPLR